MSPPPWAGVVAALLLVAAAGSGGAVAAPGPRAALPAPIDADAVAMDVALAADGDAAWTVEYRILLDTDDRVAAFETLQADVQANASNFTARFGDRMAETAAAAAAATGREMTIGSVTVAAERRALPQEYGVVTYTFEWTNFAAVEGDRLVAGDALEGLFLDAETRLRVSWPADRELVADPRPAPASVRERSVVWRGPLDFGAGEPRVVVGRPGPLDGVLPLAGAAAALLGALGGAYLLRRRGPWSGAISRRRAGDPDARDGDVAAAAGGDGPGDGGAGVGAAAGSGETAAGGGDDERTGSSGDDAAATAGPPDVPPELLSNEERVLRLLADRGGRLKQQTVVEALGWTEAKTSQVVRDLRETGAVEGFRLGRENVLRLPEDGDGERDVGDGERGGGDGERGGGGADQRGDGPDGEA